jgi:hypothetical protein
MGTDRQEYAGSGGRGGEFRRECPALQVGLGGAGGLGYDSRRVHEVIAG